LIAAVVVLDKTARVNSRHLLIMLMKCLYLLLHAILFFELVIGGMEVEDVRLTGELEESNSPSKLVRASQPRRRAEPLLSVEYFSSMPDATSLSHAYDAS
jgi:hypothetical protein